MATVGTKLQGVSWVLTVPETIATMVPFQVDAVIAQGSYTSFHGVKVRPLHVHPTLLLRSRRSTKCGEYKRCLSRARTWSRNLRWARYRDGRTYGIALAADAFTGDCWPVELFKARPIFDPRRGAVAVA